VAATAVAPEGQLGGAWRLERPVKQRRTRPVSASR
jgi:hypothetical protein